MSSFVNDTNANANAMKECIETIILNYSSLLSSPSSTSSPSNKKLVHIQCRTALKKLEEEFCPKLDALAAMVLLQGKVRVTHATVDTREEDSDKDKYENEYKSLSSTLLGILSNDEYPESCREKACSSLKALIGRIKTAQIENTKCKIVDYLKRDLVVEACPIYARRFVGEEKLEEGEEGEEIRFMMVQMMNDIFVFLEEQANSKLKSDSDNENEMETGTGTKMEMEMESSIQIQEQIRAGSALIHSLVNGALLDPYPELQRESCILLRRLCHVPPMNRSIRHHLGTIIRPIVGPSTSTSIISKNNDHHSDMNLEGRLESLSVFAKSPLSSSKACLLRHRHAKTRALAVETVTDIMMTCIDGYVYLDEDVSHENSETTSSYMDIDTVNDTDARHKSNRKLLEIISSQILPNFEAVVPYDRSASVRISLAKTVSMLLGIVSRVILERTNNEDQNDSKHQELKSIAVNDIFPRLIVLFTMGISDDSSKVSEASVSYMNEMLTSMPVQSLRTWIMIGIEPCITEVTGENYNNYLISALVFSFAGQVLDMIISNFRNTCILEQQKRFLEAFSIVVMKVNTCQDNGYVRKHVNVEEEGSDVTVAPIWKLDRMKRITREFCDAFSSDENDLFQAAKKCANALGFGKNSRKVTMDLILESLKGEHGGKGHENVLAVFDNRKDSIIVSSPLQCASVLCLLSCILQGAEIGLERSEAEAVTPILATERVLDNVHKSEGAAFALLGICQTITSVIISTRKSAYNGDDNIVRDILLCCVHLYSCELSSVPSKAIMSSFAKDLPGVRDISHLLDIHFQDLLGIFTTKLRRSKGSQWSVGDPNLQAFDSLIRLSGGKIVGDHFHEVWPILESHLDEDPVLLNSKPSRESIQHLLKTKIFFMALVESIVSDPGLSKRHLHLFAEQLVISAIIPNLIWQSGSHASVLRKLASAVLFSVVYSDEAIRFVICKLAPKLLPVLKSNLSDDDSSIRELIISSLARIFEILPAVLGEQAIDQLYPELMKGLDDSCESVRFASCDALKHFLSCGPAANYNGTAIEYMVENLFLHMDDPNPAMQERVYNTLVASIAIDKDTVTKVARVSMTSHRTPKYCKKILSLVDDE